MILRMTLFLVLPPELRLRIYREVLVEQEPIRMYDYDGRGVLHTSPRPDTALLYTSRLIYSEAVDVLYSENHFNLPAKWIPRIMNSWGAVNTAALTSISVYFPEELYRNWPECDAKIAVDAFACLLRNATSLTTLEVTLRTAHLVDGLHGRPGWIDLLQRIRGLQTLKLIGFQDDTIGWVMMNEGGSFEL
jgi:hypothetical protein